MTETTQVLVAAGHYATRWVEPVYDTYYLECGTLIKKLVREGYYERYWVQPCHETRTYRRWVPIRYGRSHVDYQVSANIRFQSRTKPNAAFQRQRAVGHFLLS